VHRVIELEGAGERASMVVEGPGGRYRHEAPFALGCDGAKSGVRRMLGIRNGWRVYGTDSAVADFEMQCDLPKKLSRIVLDPKRSYGFFYFAPGRWRFIHRINDSEDRREAITESATTELLHSKLFRARTSRFLWASAFRLGQGQSQTYRQGRWFLCGEAAHAMGPSAGAGVMVGVLARRLASRLAGRAGHQGRPARRRCSTGTSAGSARPRRRSPATPIGSLVMSRSAARVRSALYFVD
jgi:2-polyprenyl-6-methoxyphenol hydroxylase-like FAD-dependent oxidoreductase